MRKSVKILVVKIACLVVSSLSFASMQEETFWTKSTHTLKSVGQFGYDFAKAFVVTPGEKTTELAFVKTPNGLIIKAIPVKEADVNAITDILDGVKNIYNRGVTEHISGITGYVSHNKWRVACDGLALVSGLDPYGVSQVAAVTLHSGKLLKDTFETLPKIMHLRATSTQKFVMAGGFFFVASLPVVGAYDSLSQAKAAYGGRGCRGQKATLAENFLTCLGGEKDFKTCFLEAPRGIASYDGYTFQMHPTDSHPSLSPVSITNYDENQVCIISGTDPKGLATKICSDIALSGDITVAETSMKFSEAHEGLKIGEIVYHGAAKMPDGGACGFFETLPVRLADPGENVLCIASGFNPDFPQQTCIDATNHVVTVRGLTPDQYRKFNPSLSSPYVILTDPRRLGMEVRPDSSGSMHTCSVFEKPILNETEVLCINPHKGDNFIPTDLSKRSIEESFVTEKPCVPHISLWDVLKAYWYQDPHYAIPHC